MMSILLIVVLASSLWGPGRVPLDVQTTAARPRVTAKEAAVLYKRSCAPCHGVKGEGQPNVRPLTGSLAYGDSVEDVSTVIRDGIKDTPMVAFKGTLSEEQIRALADFVRTLSKSSR